MNEIVENGKTLDDGELIARGVIGVEPTGRERTAAGFGRMSWGVLFVVLGITAPIGFLLIAGAADRLRPLHSGMEWVRRRAFVLAGLSVFVIAAAVGWQAQFEPEFTARNLAVFIPVWVISITWLVLTVMLFRRLCAVVADLADQAGEYEIRRTARHRRTSLTVLAGVMLLLALPFSRLSVTVLGIDLVLNIGELILWLVMLGMVWEILREGQGIVEHSEAFAWLGGEGHDTPAEPAG